MASDNIEYEGAVGGVGINQQIELPQRQNNSVLEDIIDVNNLKLDEYDEQNWLTSSLYKPETGFCEDDGSITDWINLSNTEFLMESALSGRGGGGDASFNLSNGVNLPKKSLLNKLDMIAKGSPTTLNGSIASGSGVGTSSCSSNLSPNVSSYLRQNLSSTPATKGGHSRFDPRTFTRPQQKFTEHGFSSPLYGKTPNYSSSSSTNQLSNLNISDISLVECSPLIGIAESPTSSPMQHRTDLTFDRREDSNPPVSSPRKGETFYRKSPIKATNATYDKLQNQTQDGLNDTYNFEGPLTTSSNEQETVDLQVPYTHDNPNNTFDIAAHDAAIGNATFTSGENGIDNTNCNESANLRKKTYAVPPGSSTITEINNSIPNEPTNANLNDITYNNCDISVASDSRNKMQIRLPSAPKQLSVQKLSRDSSQDHLEDDPISETTSGDSCSVGGLYRLHDVVGLSDVQHMARMQEESLKQTLPPQHQRSATISPSSEHSLQSPSTDIYGNNDNNNFYDGGAKQTFIQHQDTNEVEVNQEQNSRGGYQQYSSQDSLPDSPYSSQSLDSQSTQGTDGLRRSMPNLNRIRGRGGGFGYNGGIARKSGIPATSHRGTKDVSNATNYGLSKIHNSNSRLGNQGSTNSSRMLPPNAIPRIGRNQQGGQHGIPSRGSTTREDKVVVGSTQAVRYQSSNRGSLMNANRNMLGENRMKPSIPTVQYSSQHVRSSKGYSNNAENTPLIQNPGSSAQNNLTSNGQSVSRIARPIGSGIPRPPGLGSRLPAPTAGRIPKLSTGSLPGSRASSVGPNRLPYSSEYY